MLEEGEIDASEGYDPSYEWPGGDASSDPRLQALPTAGSSTGKPLSPLCRLVVRSSDVLPRSQRVAVLDGLDQLTIGRDALYNNEARLRLKELAVSKHHASVFFDTSRLAWSIVDVGSMHGTFMSTANKDGDYTQKQRLSPSRVASFPRVLNHLDMITIGSTKFVVHLSLSEDCVVEEENRISLLHFPKDKKEAEKPPASSDDPKQALAKLKQSLLAAKGHPPSPVASSPSDGSYIDRSARRRERMPSRRISTPPSAVGASTPRSTAPLQPLPPSTSVTPISSENIGHRLLRKQGWTPGSALGSTSVDESLVEPLQVASSSNRAGLGVKRSAPDPVSNEGADWREEGKRRRWEDLGRDKA
jgi:pSer/pThr/pTyr-binding forkhead associated (FHA) protein